MKNATNTATALRASILRGLSDAGLIAAVAKGQGAGLVTDADKAEAIRLLTLKAPQTAAERRARHSRNVATDGIKRAAAFLRTTITAKSN